MDLPPGVHGPHRSHHEPHHPLRQHTRSQPRRRLQPCPAPASTQPAARCRAGPAARAAGAVVVRPGCRRPQALAAAAQAVGPTPGRLRCLVPVHQPAARQRCACPRRRGRRHGRPLPAAARTGPGRHEHGVAGRPHRRGSRRHHFRHQVAPPRGRRRPGPPRRMRTRHHRRDAPPASGQAARRRRRRPAAPVSGSGRGGRATAGCVLRNPAVQCRRAAAPVRAAGPGRGLCTWPGRGAPRPEAGERAGDSRRSGAVDRLRHCLLAAEPRQGQRRTA